MLRRLPILLGMAGAGALGFALVHEPAGEVPAAAGWPTSSHPMNERPQAVARAAKQDRLAVLALRPADTAPVAGARESAPVPLPMSRPAPALTAARGQTRLVAFASAPFPFTGRQPSTERPFLNVEEDGRQGRKTASGRVYWADETYSDSRVLLHVPPAFDPRRPGVMVLFFHGHGATLERDVMARQRVPEQITRSGVNAVLVAPQFAVDARDSSAGKFWTPGGLRRFLDETATRLAHMHGGAEARRAFASMPVVVVGYSGGYMPAAAALAHGDVIERIAGVVLLDGLYGELETFAAWIGASRQEAFFVSAYAASTRQRNEAFKAMLSARSVAWQTELDPVLKPGSVVFLDAEAEHRHYVTRAWAANPISDVLSRLAHPAPRPRPDAVALNAPAARPPVP
jgi:hypothetical protein